MSVEFVDTNILIYAHDSSTGVRHARAVELLHRLFEDRGGALSIQVLCEFYSTATRKLGMRSEEAESIVHDLGVWTIHRPTHSDLLSAARLQRKYKISWWDALVIQSAIDLGCTTLWSEDMHHLQRYGGLQVQNPFA